MLSINSIEWVHFNFSWKYEYSTSQFDSIHWICKGYFQIVTVIVFVGFPINVINIWINLESQVKFTKIHKNSHIQCDICNINYNNILHCLMYFLWWTFFRYLRHLQQQNTLHSNSYATTLPIRNTQHCILLMEERHCRLTVLCA